MSLWPEWMAFAQCRDGDPDAAFAAEGSDEAVLFAKGVCGRCPVRVECLEYALDRRDPGIYGGLTPTQRGTAKRKRRLSPCGTPAAWYRHRAHGETPCDPCRLAVNADRRARYVSKAAA